MNCWSYRLRGNIFECIARRLKSTTNFAMNRPVNRHWNCCPFSELRILGRDTYTTAIHCAHLWLTFRDGGTWEMSELFWLHSRTLDLCQFHEVHAAAYLSPWNNEVALWITCFSFLFLLTIRRKRHGRFYIVTLSLLRLTMKAELHWCW